MDELEHYLKQLAVGEVISGEGLEEARSRFALTRAEIERLALQYSLLPARYQRNRQTISIAQQRLLCHSRVSVIGCGGLGGHIVEQLARLGVGEIQIIDGDHFEEHNLNRQLYSSERLLGTSKVDGALQRLREINPAVEVFPVREHLTGENLDLLRGADVVTDAVDNLAARRLIAAGCRRFGIPLVHGAIAGWYGHVTTIHPGDPGIDMIYPREAGRGIEEEMGNPAFAPALIASLQVAEICKVLLGLPGQLRRRKLVIDLLDMEIEEIPLHPSSPEP